MNKFSVFAALAVVITSGALCRADAQSVACDVRPKVFVTADEVARFRQQATTPELAAQYAELTANANASAAPVVSTITFHVNEKPTRIVALRSVTQMPKLDDPEFAKNTADWANDPLKGDYLREDLDFTYDESGKTVTINLLDLDTGIRQIVWE